MDGETERALDASRAAGACGKTCEVWSRVVGYYRPVSGWHKGKQAEFKDRKTIKLTEGTDAAPESSG